MDGRFVSYLRVSTARQGRSGLGLEAQRAAVSDFLAGRVLLREVVEIESGAIDKRPQLACAFETCQLTGGTLLVARLDRLSRDAAFLLALQKAGVKFVCVDNPHATPFTVGILAVVAQHEREQISIRTKAALAAAKARGKKLGGYRGGPVPSTADAAAARRAKADTFAARISPVILELQDQGFGLRAIARELSERGIMTATGGRAWTPTGVRNVLARRDGA